MKMQVGQSLSRTYRHGTRMTLFLLNVLFNYVILSPCFVFHIQCWNKPNFANPDL